MSDNFHINVIATGSSGNCLVVNNEIMIDCGIPKKKIIKSNYNLDNLKLLLVTHKHGDHANLPFIRWCLNHNKRVYLPQAVVSMLKNEGKINIHDVAHLITFNETLKPYHLVIDGLRYDISLHPTDHYDLTNFAFEIDRSDGRNLLYATDLRTVDKTDRAPGLADLGKFDTLILEGNYDEVWLRYYINQTLHGLDPEWETERLSDDRLNKWIRANRHKIPHKFSSDLFRAVQNMRHLSKQQARLYARKHLKKNGQYFEVHRSSMFYEAPNNWT